MRLHSFSTAHGVGHTDRAQSRDHYRDLMYTVMFIAGAPIVVWTSMRLVDILFNLLWR